MSVIKCCEARWDSRIKKCPRCGKPLTGNKEDKPETETKPVSGDESGAATCSVSFDQWWQEVGSGLPPSHEDDMETHARNIARTAVYDLTTTTRHVYEVTSLAHVPPLTLAVFGTRNEAERAILGNGLLWSDFPKYNEEDGVTTSIELRQRSVGVYCEEGVILETYTWRYVDPTGLDGEWELLLPNVKHTGGEQ